MAVDSELARLSIPCPKYLSVKEKRSSLLTFILMNDVSKTKSQQTRDVGKVNHEEFHTPMVSHDIQKNTQINDHESVPYCTKTGVNEYKITHSTEQLTEQECVTEKTTICVNEPAIKKKQITEQATEQLEAASKDTPSCNTNKEPDSGATSENVNRTSNDRVESKGCYESVDKFVSHQPTDPEAV